MKKFFLLFACITMQTIAHCAQTLMRNHRRAFTTLITPSKGSPYIKSNNQLIPQPNRSVLYTMKRKEPIDYHKKSCELMANLLLTSIRNDSAKTSQELDVIFEAHETNLLLNELKRKGW